MAIQTSNGRTTLENAPADPSTLPPQPVVSSDPVETGLPAQSQSITFTGSLLNYVPLACTCISSSCKPEVTSIGEPIVGIMDPQGVEHTSGTFEAHFNQLLFTLMLDPAASVSTGSVVQETDYWKLQFQDIVPPNQAYSISHSLTSGISQTDTTTFSYTVGVTVGGSYEGMTGQISASLTESFSHSVTVSTQEADTRTFPLTQQPYAQIVGLYQLMQTFSVVPGANLQQYIAQYNKGFGKGSPMCALSGTCMVCSAGAGAVNPSQTYLWVVGYDQSAAAGGTPILSASQAAAMVDASIKMTGNP